MKPQWVADDGKTFDDEDSCRSYEKEMEAQQAQDAVKAAEREYVARFHEMSYPEGRPRTIAMNHVLKYLDYDMIQRPDRYGIPAMPEPENVAHLKDTA